MPARGRGRSVSERAILEKALSGVLPNELPACRAVRSTVCGIFILSPRPSPSSKWFSLTMSGSSTTEHCKTRFLSTHATRWDAYETKRCAVRLAPPSVLLQLFRTEEGAWVTTIVNHAEQEADGFF